MVLDAKIFMYDFSDLKLNDHIETCSNPRGLCSVNNEPESNIVLACPDKTLGQLAISFYKEISKESTSKDSTVIIKAHTSVVTCIELDNRGTKVATASEKV